MGARVALVACMLVAGWATLAPVAEAEVTEHSVPTPSAGLDQITPGPDGALWFTERAANKIGRITTSGSVTEFPIPTAGIPSGIVAGPDGALWFTEVVGKIGRITTAGTVTEFSVPTDAADPSRITRGPDGALWFTESNASKVGRITTAGQVTEFPVTTPNAHPEDIVPGPDGALWFTENSARQVGRITTAGQVTEFSPPSSTTFGGITRGPDDALWVTESNTGKVARVTTAGAFTEFPIPSGVVPVVPTAFWVPEAIAAGPDGALWFTYFTNKIGRITTAGDVAELRLRNGGAGAGPRSITAGPDGALWFTDPEVNSIGRTGAGPLPPADSVKGGFATGPSCGLRCVPPTYALDVSSGPGGESPRGEVIFDSGTLFQNFVAAQGSPTCLFTSGNRATVGVEFAGSSSAPARSAVIFLEDNGAAGDRFAVVDGPAGMAPSNCPAQPPAGVTLATAADGDVLVTDVQPPSTRPSTRDQCRRGGWATFGFKSEGQCVAFVRLRALRACLAERERIGRPAFRQWYGEGRFHRRALRRCVRLTIGS